MTTLQDHLDDLITSNTAADTARHQLIGAVVRARLGGTSWADVGDALGISKMTAYNRYHAYIPDVSESTAAALASAMPERFSA